MEPKNTDNAAVSTPYSVRRLRALGGLFAVVAFTGFLDAAYLAVEYLSGKVPPCTIIKGCDIVTTSSYAAIGGVPVSLLGALYYLAIIVLAIVAIDTKNARLLRLIGWLSIIGFAFSVYLFLLQALVIHAFCVYCIGSGTTSTIIFAAGMYALSTVKARS